MFEDSSTAKILGIKTVYRDCRLFKGCYKAALASLTNSLQCGTEKEKENKLPSASSEMHSESGNRTGSKALLKERKQNKHVLPSLYSGRGFRVLGSRSV